VPIESSAEHPSPSITRLGSVTGVPDSGLAPTVETPDIAPTGESRGPVSAELPTWPGEPTSSCPDRRRIVLTTGGPALVEGPVEVVTDDGTVVTSDRFLVALCMCHRSKNFPFCDTSHRKRARSFPEE
jgi:hypothetical protein